MTEEPTNKVQHQQRRRLMIGASVVFVLLFVIAAFYWFLIGQYYFATSDAYVNGNIIPITAAVSGTIVKVNVDETQWVKLGQLLVQLDSIDTLVALGQARANLIETVRQTQQLFVNQAGLQANLIEREVVVQKARQDLLRRSEAISLGAVSQEELTHAQDTVKTADAERIQAKATLQANTALISETTLREHPQVRAAAYRFQKAYVNYTRAAIRAPVAGEIAKRTAQVGWRVAAETQLMALIPLDQIWVDANFKESQLRFMRVGQPVKVTSDLYGASVVYHGKLVGFSAGTGSAFALLPPQNATGNWIKVVQRLPVRIALPADEIAAHPLRIGLSMHCTVDTHQRSGPFNPKLGETTQYTTPLYHDLEQQVQAETSRIIDTTIKQLATERETGHG